MLILLVSENNLGQTQTHISLAKRYRIEEPSKS